MNDPVSAAVVSRDATKVINELTAELAVATSGVGFIAHALDRLVATLQLRNAVAVVHDPVLGPQVFNAGRRPLPLDVLPSELLARGPGIHTEPALPDQAATLATVAHLCDIALRIDRLQYESLHDPLTGLYNRRGFDVQLLHAVSRAQRHSLGFALVLLDLDNFKAVNDRFGHQSGDVVLQSVGDRLRLSLRAGDVAARIGGDEFAMLLHLEDVGNITPILDRLGRGTELGVAQEVTWTIGAAMCPHEGATIDELFVLADHRLYEAKGARSREEST